MIGKRELSMFLVWGLLIFSAGHAILDRNAPTIVQKGVEENTVKTIQKISNFAEAFAVEWGTLWGGETPERRFNRISKFGNPRLIDGVTWENFSIQKVLSANALNIQKIGDNLYQVDVALRVARSVLSEPKEVGQFVKLRVTVKDEGNTMSIVAMPLLIPVLVGEGEALPQPGDANSNIPSELKGMVENFLKAYAQAQDGKEMANFIEQGLNVIPLQGQYVLNNINNLVAYGDPIHTIRVEAIFKENQEILLKEQKHLFLTQRFELKVKNVDGRFIITQINPY